MQQSATTKLNDAVTERQFNRFLTNAKLPPQWVGEVKVLEDVLKIPIILQDKLFSCWISQYLKNGHIYEIGGHIYNIYARHGGHIYKKMSVIIFSNYNN